MRTKIKIYKKKDNTTLFLKEEIKKKKEKKQSLTTNHPSSVVMSHTKKKIDIVSLSKTRWKTKFGHQLALCISYLLFFRREKLYFNYSIRWGKPKKNKIWSLALGFFYLKGKKKYFYSLKAYEKNKKLFVNTIKFVELGGKNIILVYKKN
jgi:hypothetical protein